VLPTLANRRFAQSPGAPPAALLEEAENELYGGAQARACGRWSPRTYAAKKFSTTS